jgi:hypothetical protein
MGGEAQLPYHALVAPLWAKAPCDPREIDEWEADRVFKMLFWLNLEQDIQRQMAGQSPE